MPITKLRANLQLKDDSVTSAEIKDLTITKADIAPGTLDGSVFADGGIPSSKIDASGFAGNGLVYNATLKTLDINIDTAALSLIADQLSVTSLITSQGNTFNAPGKLVQLDGSGRLGVGSPAPNSRFDVNGAITIRSLVAPAVAPGASAVVYFDAAVNKVMVSKNGGAYTELQDGSNYVDLEEVTGPIDGVNAVFTTQYQPVPGSVHLYLNGVLLMPGIGKDFSISSNVITLAYGPSAGSRLVASYRK